MRFKKKYAKGFVPAKAMTKEEIIYVVIVGFIWWVYVEIVCSSYADICHCMQICVCVCLFACGVCVVCVCVLLLKVKSV